LLKGLAPRETEELVAALSAGAVAAEIVTEIQRRAEGNPFFIREIVQHLLEEGLLSKDRAPPELPVPEGVRQVVERRLARLSADANGLLRAAWVFDGPFRYDVGAAVAEVGAESAMAAIDETLATRLIEPTAHADTYDFTHALIRHTLYSAWNPSRR